MLYLFVIVFAFLVAGDSALRAIGIPIPGAVVGLVVLSFVFAGTNGRLEQAAGRLFDTLIPVAPLVFVPAAVGIVANTEAIASAWLPIIGAITIGTASKIVLTGLAAQALLRLAKPD